MHILPTSTSFSIKCWNSVEIQTVFYRHISSNEPIDLLNVAFENPRKIKAQQQDNVGGGPSKATNDYARYEVPDRITGIEEVNELRRLCPGRTWNFVSTYFVMGPLLISSIQVEINVPFEVSLIVNLDSLCTYYLGVSRYASSGRGTHGTRTNCHGSCKLLLVSVNCTSLFIRA